jgi:hypothetical protein
MTTYGLPYLNDEQAAELCAADYALLALTDDAQPGAKRLLAELDALRAAGALPGVATGALDLADPYTFCFQAASDWLRDIEALPYVALYRGGRLVERFAATSGAYVLARLQRLGFLPAPQPAALPVRVARRAA